jgi:2'-5' RNA ligase
MAKRIYNQQALFGELYAYLVVISPPENVKLQIAQFKQQMNEIADIGERNLHSIGHITLTDKLIDDPGFAGTIAALLQRQKQFEVRISGIDFFNHGANKKTIYLKVEDPQPVINLMECVKAKSRSPHLSLAKNISAPAFEKLQPFIAAFNFTASWPCTEVVVLKKLMTQKHLGFRERIVIDLV